MGASVNVRFNFFYAFPHLEANFLLTLADKQQIPAMRDVNL